MNRLQGEEVEEMDTEDLLFTKTLKSIMGCAIPNGRISPAVQLQCPIMFAVASAVCMGAASFLMSQRSK